MRKVLYCEEVILLKQSEKSQQPRLNKLLNWMWSSWCFRQSWIVNAVSMWHENDRKLKCVHVDKNRLVLMHARGDKMLRLNAMRQLSESIIKRFCNTNSYWATLTCSFAGSFILFPSLFLFYLHFVSNLLCWIFVYVDQSNQKDRRLVRQPIIAETRVES
jgi:hypothetical protein